ncbi:MAG TPA: hypothetical protein VKB76_00380 [Ktedonobacterales bacterium]|nr:hypothetical protein [Ktedonobacterales bacterium]
MSDETDQRDSVTPFTTTMNVTQMSVEMWAPGTPAMYLTQVSVEMWASVAAYVPPAFTGNPIIMA